MTHGIYDKYHYWQYNGFMVSDEHKKKLNQFKDIDEAINHYFLNGDKEFARYLNTIRVIQNI